MVVHFFNGVALKSEALSGRTTKLTHMIPRMCARGWSLSVLSAPLGRNVELEMRGIEMDDTRDGLNLNGGRSESVGRSKNECGHYCNATKGLGVSMSASWPQAAKTSCPRE
jgi:hypothetical protein